MRNEALLPVEHGGSLGRAAALFPHASKPYVDLSTGINPHPYPFFELPASALTRLPEPARVDELAKVAAASYGAASALQVVPAPGTQSLLPLVASLVRPGRALVLGPTYQEHARAAALAGHRVERVGGLSALEQADLAVVVNPNNPDGRIVVRGDLLSLAEKLKRKGGLLVVDEAFMDVGPQKASVAGDVEAGGLVVLRSFGKFYGMAGLRLGFAIAPEQLAERLRSQLGPWAVSGPALEYGLRALADKAWQEAMRARLAEEAAWIDKVFASAGVEVTGGTSLFRHVRFPGAALLYRALGEKGIFLRAFADRPTELRCGLPGSEDERKRLEHALATWAKGARRIA